jgi:hypothetical protein
MFVYRSRFLTRGEVWYDAEPDDTAVDWIYYRQRSSPVARTRWHPTYTRLIDLTKTPSQLLAEMEEKTVRKITQAREKDRLQWERCDAKDAKTLDGMERMWNEFAAAQKTPRLERDWLDRMAEAGSLDVSSAKDPEGNVLAYHLVLLTPRRARQLIAISPYRSVPDMAWRGAVSRANCFIHWNNFLSFQARGIPGFDFGGWYVGTTNMQYLGINRFKQSFGGQVVREFECEQIRTLKGWLVLTAARMLERTRRPKPTGGTPAERPPKSKNDTHATTKDCEVSPAF